MKTITLTTIFLIIISFTGYSKIWRLSDENLDVQFDDQALNLTVRDKRCNKTWVQDSFKDEYSITKISQKGNSLTFDLKGNFPLTVNITLSDVSDLIFSISAAEKTVMDDLMFPPAFKTPDVNHYVLMTDGEGMLLSVDNQDYPLGINNIYSMAGGLCMPWLGITDKKFETGYIAILDTPNDAAFRSFHDGDLITFEPLWHSTLGKFGYTRKVIYHFFDKGGYVAQCKKYRDYAWKKNDVITLRENQEKFPAMEKMIGAVRMYVWDQARQVSFAKEMKKSGINKAFILWDPNHTPYPVVGYDDSLKELGYASGVQDLWRDIHPADSISLPDSLDPTFLRRPHFPGLYPEITVKKKDGTVDKTSFGSHVCPKAILPLIPSLRADKEFSLYPHEGWFVDVYLSKELFECYDKNHPLTRTQYKQAVLDIYKLFSDRYKAYTGGEWGADYGIPGVVFADGMMTLHRTWFSSDAYRRGTIYYVGDWGDARPSIMISTCTATDEYLKYSINEYTRVPLYELVYHDAIVTSWRWEDSNHKMPELWWKKDLFNVLYGTPPLWSIDRELWRKYKLTFIESYKNVLPWIQKVGYDELVSHKFITADRKVQESDFSSGNKVIVNFGNTDYMFNGKMIKAKGYITIPE